MLSGCRVVSQKLSGAASVHRPDAHGYPGLAGGPSWDRRQLLFTFFTPRILETFFAESCLGRCVGFSKKDDGSSSSSESEE